MHNIFEYLLDPPHKVTVAVVGCGGTGSQVINILARMNVALMELGHLGLHVTAYDDDKISEANIGRQLFAASEIGDYKSISLISRVNRFFGTNWEAMPDKFLRYEQSAHNIVISCVDSFETRMKIAKLVKPQTVLRDQRKRFYWLDFGNSNNSGQAILGSVCKCDVPLPCFDEWVKRFPVPKETKDVPSCSLAEALEKQDLLINSSLANAGMQLLWRLFRETKTPYHGLVLNLQTLSLNPIKI
jgi:PRTRC genetic system ThiF family protein